MQKQMTNLWFRLMALEYRLKADSVALRGTLEAAGIRPGLSVLDFGCGPGRYALPAARIVGSMGKVYAVDVHPLAIRMIEKAAEKSAMLNLRAIRSDCDTGLQSETIDIVLLYDALHDVENKEAVLKELHRVLKPGGVFCYKDHTLNGEPMFALMQSSGFSLQDKKSSQGIFGKVYSEKPREKRRRGKG